MNIVVFNITPKKVQPHSMLQIVDSKYATRLIVEYHQHPKTNCKPLNNTVMLVSKGEEIIFSKPWSFILNQTLVSEGDLHEASINQVIEVSSVDSSLVGRQRPLTSQLTDELNSVSEHEKDPQHTSILKIIVGLYSTERLLLCRRCATYRLIVAFVESYLILIPALKSRRNPHQESSKTLCHNLIPASKGTSLATMPASKGECLVTDDEELKGKNVPLPKPWSLSWNDTSV